MATEQEGPSDETILTPYSREKARELGQQHITKEQTPTQQMQAIADLPPEDRRQLLLGILHGDI